MRFFNPSEIFSVVYECRSDLQICVSCLDMVVIEGTEKHKFSNIVQSGELVKYSVNYLNKGHMGQMSVASYQLSI